MAHIFPRSHIRPIISAADGPRGPEYKEEIIMLNENAVKLLKSGLWDLATCADGEPNVVPVARNSSYSGTVSFAETVRRCFLCHRICLV